MSHSSELIASVKLHEGLRKRAYQDTESVWTIGYGTNLQELQIDEPLATLWLLRALDEARRAAGGFPWWNNLNGPRKDVVVEMLYNLGLTRFSRFTKMLRALVESDFDAAAEEMLQSKWASQVGVRAARLVEQMRTGEYWQ